MALHALQHAVECSALLYAVVMRSIAHPCQRTVHAAQMSCVATCMHGVRLGAVGAAGRTRWPLYCTVQASVRVVGRQVGRRATVVWCMGMPAADFRRRRPVTRISEHVAGRVRLRMCRACFGAL